MVRACGWIVVVALPLATAFAQQRPRGDGRGLATFGDRFTEGFGQRGLTPMSNTPLAPMNGIPLAPMGGLEAPGWSARAPSSDGRDSSSTHRRRSRRWLRIESTPESSVRQVPRSVASLRGAVLAETASAPPPTIPTLVPPAIVFDARPAEAELAALVRREADRRDRLGDVDAARQLRAAADR